MILRTEPGTFLLIPQPDHARLAAEIISAWMPGGLPESARRDQILLATREHDNGWMEEDAETIVDAAGDPVDFVGAGREVKERVWPRGVGRLAAAHPYVAALVAQHALTVYGDHRPKPEWHRFFETMAAQRAVLLARAGDEAAATIDEDYQFLRMADLLSLAFCDRWKEPVDYAGYHIALTGETLHVTPDPFGGARIPLRVLARQVPRRRYASSADLRAALDEAEMVMVEGEAVGK